MRCQTENCISISLKNYWLIAHGSQLSVYGLIRNQHLIPKFANMTNNELLHDSLLDIIFDNRNKEYGAYTLRKEYNHRLLISLGAVLSLILFLVMISGLNDNGNNPNDQPKNKGLIVTVIELPEEKIKEPEQPVEEARPEPVHSKPAEPVAAVEFSPIKIVPDEIADPDPVASQADMINKQISTTNAEGKDHTGVVTTDKPYAPRVGNGENIPVAGQTIIPDSNPEFPGGQHALMKFLLKHLNTPDEPGSGEKKMIRARFQVDIHGIVSLVEIVKSAGDSFDKEVIRVCKKMPKWKPAIQNGIPVPMSYVLPVTFIGIDE
jgi:protein TonB